MSHFSCSSCFRATKLDDMIPTWVHSGKAATKAMLRLSMRHAQQGGRAPKQTPLREPAMQRPASTRQHTVQHTLRSNPPAGKRHQRGHAKGPAGSPPRPGPKKRFKTRPDGIRPSTPQNCKVQTRANVRKPSARAQPSGVARRSASCEPQIFSKACQTSFPKIITQQDSRAAAKTERSKENPTVTFQIQLFLHWRLQPFWLTPWGSGKEQAKKHATERRDVCLS